MTIYILPLSSNEKYTGLLAELEEVLNGDLVVEDALVLRANSMRAETLLNLIFAEDYILQESPELNTTFQPASYEADQIELAPNGYIKCAGPDCNTLFKPKRKDAKFAPGHKEYRSKFYYWEKKNDSNPGTPQGEQPEENEPDLPDNPAAEPRKQTISKNHFIVRPSGELITLAELNRRLRDHDIETGVEIDDYLMQTHLVVSTVSNKLDLYPSL